MDSIKEINEEFNTGLCEDTGRLAKSEDAISVIKYYQEVLMAQKILLYKCIYITINDE